MSKLPDFEGLALFAKVAETRSFAAAARDLGLSVATVSRGVGRLEDRLGTRLFNRTSRRLALTASGDMLAERAANVLSEAENAEAAARELSATPRGLVRLAVPMSYGLRWVARILPDFFRLYPQVSIDLHLSDAAVDLIADGFDAALRIAILTDSSLVARRITGVGRFIVAAPSYITEHGEPRHPRDLAAHHCLGYAYRAQQDVWKFRNGKGEEENVKPGGPLRVTNADALIPTVLSGLGIAELPEFIAGEHLKSGAMRPLLQDWALPTGGLYFVTPTARARPAKVEVLGDFFAARLSHPVWRWPA